MTYSGRNSVNNQLELKPTIVRRKLKLAYQREQAEAEAYQREQAARAEAKAEALQREKQIRSEVEHEARRAVQLREKELEVDRLRRKLAQKEAKERQPQLSSASHLVRAPTPTYGSRPNRGRTSRCSQP